MSDRTFVRAVVARHRVGLGFAALAAIGAAALELVLPAAVYAVARLVAAPPADMATALATVGGAALLGVLLRYVLLAASNLASHAVAFRVMTEVRTALLEKLARVPAAYLAQNPSGTLKKRVIDDVAALEGVLAHNLPDFMSGVVMPVLATLWLATIDWRLALLSLALVPIAVATQAATMRNMGETYAHWHDTEQAANARVLEFVRGIVVLKAFDREVDALGKLKGSVQALSTLAADMTKRTMGGYTVFSALLQTNLLVVVPAGLWMLERGMIDAPVFVLFVAVGGGLTAPLLKLMFVFGALQRTMVGAGRIHALLTAEERATPEAPAAAPTAFDVAFDGVTLTYPGRTTPALDDVSFTAKAGTRTALVGPSGAGKSTAAAALDGTWPLAQGTVSIGGVRTDALDPAVHNALVTVVSQTTALFDGTVMDNVRLADPDASDADVHRVCKAAAAHDFITALPLGYDTPLGDRGAQLSGGQRQRLGIARALLKDAPIVVLDEVTANVDATQEAAIREGLRALLDGRTVIEIAHRLHTIQDADTIVVLEDSRVVGTGAHDALLARDADTSNVDASAACATYARLWTAQTESAAWRLGTQADAEAQA